MGTTRHTHSLACFVLHWWDRDVAEASQARVAMEEGPSSVSSPSAGTKQAFPQHPIWLRTVWLSKRKRSGMPSAGLTAW